MTPVKTLVLLSLSVFYTAAYSHHQSLSVKDNIVNFTIKEGLLSDNKIIAIACDEKEKFTENVQGSFLLTINGFQQKLIISKGITTLPQPIVQSSFLHLCYENEHGTQQKLYYIIKKNEGIKPIKISWWVFIIIPTILIWLGGVLRKFILVAIIILAFFTFNSINGLNTSAILNILIDGLKKSLF